MKLNYIIASIAVAFAATACDSKLEVFEPGGDSFTGTAVPVSNVATESLPGQIKLSWDDSDAQYEYMRMWYKDPKQGGLEVKKLISPSQLGKTEIIIDNTRARYGDYTFFFQAFNVAGQGSNIVEFKAQSGPAPKTFTEPDKSKRTKVNIAPDQLSTDNQEPNEGPVTNLVDGKTGTFFHTRWSGTQVPLPQYVQIDFNEVHTAFAVKYCTRVVGNSDGYPTAATMQVQPVGTDDWVDVGTISEGMPTARNTASWFETPWFLYEAGFDKFRFLVTAVTDNKNYFHMSELEFYDVALETYDPETDEEEVEPVK